MGIYREVETEVTCDTCGERIKAWCSAGMGVSRAWAAYYARSSMSFNITMDFLGLDEVQREIERLATASELKDLNKKIVKKAGKVGLEESEGQIRKKAYSKNPMKSGRRGSRTGQHAADNVPEKGTTQSGNYGEVIGWEKSDTSPFFYMKFHEWGTTMHKPKKFMLEAARPTYRALKSIAEEEYEKVLKEKLGG